MIIPDDRDELLEWAARRIQQASFLDSSIPAFRQKGERANSRRFRRAVEDAELAERISMETRQRCADELRRLLNRPDLTELAVLDHLARLPKNHLHSAYLREAFYLSSNGKRWLTIECAIRCDGNSIPPDRASTDSGRG